MSVRRRRDLGIGYIPEDRLRAGMVLDFTIAENYLLGHEWQRAWGGGFLLRLKGIHAEAGAMLRRYDVRTGTQGVSLMGRTLSGGNQQKVVIARAIACQPTRGLDIGATQFVYTILHEARDQGVGVVLFSLDLDEILELSDRIAVMFNGRIAGVLPRSEANAQTIGALMTVVAE